MVRLALLLMIAAGLIIFALQNLTPFSLIILGISTPPFPLGLWVLLAIAAGVTSSLITATLFNVAAPHSRRPAVKRPTASRFSPTDSDWEAPQSPSEPRIPVNPPRSTQSTPPKPADDWEQRRPLEEWEVWDGYQEPAKPATENQSPPHYSRFPSYANHQAHEDFQTHDPPPMNEPEVWDDWDEEDQNDGESAQRPVVDQYRGRTDFEVKQEPKSRYQSGSLYSYSYRDEEPVPPKADGVYDAEFRVITPPYHPDPDPVDASSDDDNWIDDDDSESDRDRPDRPSTPPS